VTLTLEEQRALNKPISEEAISSTKTALMGPLSGIGDSVFKAVFMTIFAAIGAGMAIDGNVLGPFVFLIPNVLLNVLSRKYFVDYGYKFGTKLISKMKNSNIINTFVEATTFVGMMIVGAMVVGFVKVPLDLVFNISGSEINILNILNGIVPSLLPVSLVLVYYLILKKYKKGMYIVILLSFIIGILGKIIGIF
jgi:PTS system mannose-specific IID component